MQDPFDVAVPSANDVDDRTPCLECRLTARLPGSDYCHAWSLLIGVDPFEERLDEMEARDLAALAELERKHRQDQQYAGLDEYGRPLDRPAVSPESLTSGASTAARTSAAVSAGRASSAAGVTASALLSAPVLSSSVEPSSNEPSVPVEPLSSWLTA
jgi:hypothetical protein